MTRISVVVVCVLGLWACGDNGLAPPDASSCPAPFELCGSTCTDTVNDTQNCGACGTVCPGGMLCSSGACTATCAATEVECAGECISPESDRRYCGASADCSGANAGAQCPDGEVCSAGQCAVSCVSGELVCADHCVDPNTDNQFCGASSDCTGANVGMACPTGSVCDGTGHCAQQCVSGELVCGAQCVDPLTDRRFCGATDCAGGDVGMACADGFVCDGTGNCALSCDATRLECNDSCIDPQTDVNFCGATDCAGGDVGMQCTAGQACVGGVCAALENGVIAFTGAAATFTVPLAATSLTFTAAGAQGGSAETAGGLGAVVSSTIAVSPGEVLTIIVGGTPAGNGGGGGTFVLHSDGSLVIAAGGGGGGAGECCGGELPGNPGVATPDGTIGTDRGCGQSPGGTAGAGGSAGTGGVASTAGGGAGYLGDGGDGMTTPDDQNGSPGLGGKSPADDAAGGAGFTAGGFGGGGGSSNNGFWTHGAGGGGGGYSGGGTSCNTANWSAGGGGGSFNPGTNATGSDGAQTGNGFVQIQAP